MIAVAPEVLAAIVANVPARIVKRLDADRSVAERWTWEGHAVRTDGGETVTLAPVEGVLREATAIRCSCLLSPRCFHVLAVVATLQVLDGVEVETKETESVLVTDLVPVSAGMRRVAQRAAEVARDVLRVGAHGVGAVLEGELLRVVHRARIEGLHRLAAATLRTVRDLRELRARSDDFVASVLVDDLRDVVATARMLERDTVDASFVGTARRSYQKVGHLRLLGLCCEPVVARGGQVGVVTHLVDDSREGRLWSIGDVQPGDVSRAVAAYDAPIAMGDTSITHRALSRAGLFVQDATGSVDGRLGAGRDVKAVRASNDRGWQVDAIRAKFAVPLQEQLARGYAALSLPDDRRPRGGTLLFVSGTILGSDANAVWIQGARGPFRLVAPSMPLGQVDVLQRLASTCGASIEVIGHLVPDAPRSIVLVALSTASAPAEQGFRLPDEWKGVINAGWDALSGAHVAGTAKRSEQVSSAGDGTFDPTSALRRRVERLALHGVRSLPPEATAAVDRERAALAAAMMPHGARVLGALSAAVRAREGAIVDAWSASAAYVRAASVATFRDAWLT